jgi:hypothetical protein
MLWQAETGFYLRLAGGYLNVHTARGTDLPAPLAELAKNGVSRQGARGFRSFVTRARLAAILVQPGPYRTWPRILGELGLRGQATGGVILYRTAARVPQAEKR